MRAQMGRGPRWAASDQAALCRAITKAHEWNAQQGRGHAASSLEFRAQLHEAFQRDEAVASKQLQRTNEAVYTHGKKTEAALLYQREKVFDDRQREKVFDDKCDDNQNQPLGSKVSITNAQGPAAAESFVGDASAAGDGQRRITLQTLVDDAIKRVNDSTQKQKAQHVRFESQEQEEQQQKEFLCATNTLQSWIRSLDSTMGLTLHAADLDEAFDTRGQELVDLAKDDGMYLFIVALLVYMTAAARRGSSVFLTCLPKGAALGEAYFRLIRPRMRCDHSFGSAASGLISSHHLLLWSTFCSFVLQHFQSSHVSPWLDWNERAGLNVLNTMHEKIFVGQSRYQSVRNMIQVGLILIVVCANLCANLFLCAHVVLI